MSSLKDLLYYDPSSPSCLRWKVDRHSGAQLHIVTVRAGEMAGWIDSGGYYMVTCLRKQRMVARVVWELETGESLGTDEVDHIDGNIANNLISNLRRVTHALNSKNRKKRSDNKTGHVGVSKQDSGGDRWYVVAQYNLGGKMVRKRWPLAGQDESEVVTKAVEWRKTQTEVMLKEGYTERHINGNT